MIWRQNNPITFYYQARGLLFMLLVLISLTLTACTPETPATSIPTQPIPEETEPLPNTPTHPLEQTTHTPIPVIPQILLLAPPGSDPALLAEIQPVLEELAAQGGYSLEVRSNLTPEGLHDDLQMVVSLPPDPGLEKLAGMAPNTPFLAIGFSDLEEVPNITSIYPRTPHPGWEGFMAGVIAALVTPDWRVGVISVSDTADGIAARTGFMNGVVYFCGTCRQIYPPFLDSQNQLIQYPLFIELPSSATETEWMAAADTLLERAVETIYVVPTAGGESLLAYLAEAGVKLVGGTLPPEELTDHWVATVSLDPSFSLYSLIQKTLQDQETPRNSAALQISHINPDLFSPGRQMLAGNILADLLAGYIETDDIQQELDLP